MFEWNLSFVSYNCLKSTKFFSVLIKLKSKLKDLQIQKKTDWICRLDEGLFVKLFLLTSSVFISSLRDSDLYTSDIISSKGQRGKEKKRLSNRENI